MRVLFAFLLSIVGAAAQTAGFNNTSAASGSDMLAPDSIVAAVGDNLAAQEVKSDGAELQTALGGVSVQVVDSAGVTRLASLYYVSPKQINYVLPTGTAPGMVTVNILNNGSQSGLTAQAQVQAVAPSLYSANGDGKGVAAASALRRVIPTNFLSPVTVYQCGDQPGTCEGVPIDPGIDAPVFLSFYGTGIRGAKTVTVTIGGVDVPLLYTGPQPTWPGLDQVNVPLPLDLHGKGLVDVVVTADGAMSNAVQINVQ